MRLVREAGMSPLSRPQRMGRARLWLLGLLGAAVLGSVPARQDERRGAPAAEPGPAHRRVTPTLTRFALRLYRRLAAGAPGNVLLSPLGVSSALALLSLGAPDNTSGRILEGLGFNLTETPPAVVHRGFRSLLRSLGLPSPKLELKAGSALFLDKRLRPRRRFLEDARALYGAPAFSANLTDAAARAHINGYVRKQTYGLVAGCLQAFARDTRLVLSNFLFFKGERPWHPVPRASGGFRGSFRPCTDRNELEALPEASVCGFSCPVCSALFFSGSFLL